MGWCWVFWWGFFGLQNIWGDYYGVKICFFTWGVTGLAPPELLILCCRSGALGFVGFDFTWISKSRLSFFASFFNLIGIGRIGLDFVRIRRIRFHFVWIWGWLWRTNCWGCPPFPLFRSRLFHSDVVRHPVGLWSSLIQNFQRQPLPPFLFVCSWHNYEFVTFPGWAPRSRDRWWGRSPSGERALCFPADVRSQNQSCLSNKRPSQTEELILTL